MEIEGLIQEVEKLKETTSLEATGGKQQVETPKIKERKATLDEYKYLTGHQVRIINPSGGEGNIGTVDKTGRLYVTVRLPNGEFKNRIPKNLRVFHDE